MLDDQHVGQADRTAFVAAARLAAADRHAAAHSRHGDGGEQSEADEEDGVSRVLALAEALVQQHGTEAAARDAAGAAFSAAGSGADSGRGGGDDAAAAGLGAAPWERPLGQARANGSLRPLGSSSSEAAAAAALSLDATSALTAGWLTFAGPPSALLRDRRRSLAQPFAASSRPLASASTDSGFGSGFGGSGRAIPGPRKQSGFGSGVGVAVSLDGAGAQAAGGLARTSSGEGSRSDSRGEGSRGSMRRERERRREAAAEEEAAATAGGARNQVPSPTEATAGGGVHHPSSGSAAAGAAGAGVGGLMDAWRATRPSSSGDSRDAARARALGSSTPVSPGGAAGGRRVDGGAAFWRRRKTKIKTRGCSAGSSCRRARPTRSSARRSPLSPTRRPRAA